jgi:hypothetical protein
MSRSTLRGGCHCGRLTLAFETAQAPATLVPRACDCSFCRKHGAAWVSDPAGTLAIAAREMDGWGEYRQGSERARFLLCHDCGVLVAVVFAQDGRVFGAVNAVCLEPADTLDAALPASPQRLSPGEKTTRWRQLWTPDVRLPFED